MPDDRQKKDREESAPIDEKQLQTGKIEYEHTGTDRDREARDDTGRDRDSGDHPEKREHRDMDPQSRGERSAQAPLQGPSRQAVNDSDVPGELAENMGLNQTFATDDQQDTPAKEHSGKPASKKGLPGAHDGESRERGAKKGEGSDQAA